MRLQRQAIAAALGWAVPGIKAMAKGQRSVANWDEDSITMAVEAARQVLINHDRNSVGQITLASSTLPFADRSNSGIVKDALNLTDHIGTGDVSGSRRAATTGLINMLNAGDADGDILLVASECREAKPGSNQEMLYGHGAAAVLLGKHNPVTETLGTASIHSDLVDQYRRSDSKYDYALEVRWVRQEGYLKLIPSVTQKVLQKSGVKAADIDYFILPAQASVAKSLRPKLRLDNAEFVDSLMSEIGDSGVPHSLIMLTKVLEKAAPGQLILITGFGQGADAMLLRTTEWITKYQADTVNNIPLHEGTKTDNYIRYLVMRKQLALDYGMRSERDNRTALSAFYRNREAISGFIGGRCKECNTLQFPRTTVCVKCRAFDTQEAESFSGLTGKVKSFTEDWLAYTPLPPLIYGNVTFPGGANIMMEFSDVNEGELAVGMEARMSFRIKDIDERRGFHRYFWKAVPNRYAGTKKDG
ncbi:MAG: OB-fold domain-containing protein [Gammaproteobacteria bacterium]|nr:OB-fold domain-containing protein [Gammaproteobacteria bacterium]